ncbi:MAG: hypothetical protein V7742_14920 [Halioglobus sp.]
MSIHVDTYQQHHNPSIDQVREMIKQGVIEINDTDYKSVSMPSHPFDGPAVPRAH